MSLWDVLDVVSEMDRFFRHPRFWTSVAVAAGLAWLIHRQMETGDARTIATMGIIIAGVAIGFVWESGA